MLKMTNFTTARPTYLGGTEGYKELAQHQTEELMFSMSPTKMPHKLLDGFRNHFRDENRLTLDSGGFDLLLDPERADEFDVDELIDRVNRLGLLEQDTIMSLDFPVPHGDAIPITSQEVLRRQKLTTSYYEQMKRKLPIDVHPIVHGRNYSEMKTHLGQYDLAANQMVAFGSNLALLKPRLYKCIGNGKGQTKTKIPKLKDTWDRIMEGILLLRKNEQNVFALGMGGQRASQVAFLLGAKEVDATSWWGYAMTGKMMLHELGKGVHVRDKHQNYTSTDVAYIKSLWKDDEYPLSQAQTGLDWKTTWKGLRGPNEARKGGLDGTTMRALHNIWSSDLDAQTCSDFAGDPDGLAKFLIGRDQMKTTQFEKRVLLALKHVGSEATVQAKLMNYSKF